MTKVDIYQDVTNRIIDALEKGLDGSFELPWHGISQIPENAHTGKKYKGVNVPLLWVYQMCEGYQSGIWATYTGSRLQDAVDDSAKDILRKSLTLNAYKRRLLRNNDDRSKIVERFQDPVNNPYQEKLSAAAILNRSHYDVSILSTTNVSDHPHKEKSHHVCNDR